MAITTEQLPLELRLPLRSAYISNDPNLVCKLLCTSKAVRAATKDACAGQLSIRVALENQPHREAPRRLGRLFPTWLSRNGALVKHLDVDIFYWDEAEAAIAAALQQAAPSLLLQSFEACGSGAFAGAMIQQLPVQHLTSLTYGQMGPYQDRDRHTAVARGLARLTNLQDLSLKLRNTLDDYHGQPYPKALAALTKLTRFSLEKVCKLSADWQQSFTPQLRELSLALSPGLPPRLRMGHLTALTRLDWDHQHARLKAGDVLPPNLLSLVVTCEGTLQPLLPLKQLRQLTLHNFHSFTVVPARQLLQLSSSLTNLLGLHLHYKQQDALVAAAPAWSSLPLKSMHIHAPPGQAGEQVAAVTLEQLSKLTGLNCLKITGSRPFEAKAETFAAALRKLWYLEDLEIKRASGEWPDYDDYGQQEDGGGSGDGDGGGGAEQSIEVLAEAIASLRYLSDLEMDIPRETAAAARLMAAGWLRGRAQPDGEDSGPEDSWPY